MPESAVASMFAGGVGGLFLWLSICLAVRERVGGWGPSVATGITVSRGAIGGALLAFAVAEPTGVAAWLLPAAFAIAGLLDAVDGPIARRRNAVSPFGERLDTEADGWLVLVGSLLVVANDLVPAWFLLVGCTRYGYVAGLWLRHQRGLAIGSDDAELVNALVYTATMTGIWVALLPVTGPSVATPLLAALGLALLGTFTRSWLVVTGRLRPAPDPGR